MNAGNAQIYPFNIKRRTGGKYYPLSTGSWSNANGILTINQLVCMPFVVGMPELLSGLAIVTNGTASSFARMGIYYDNNGVPDVLAFDSGQISTSPTTAVVDFPFSANTQYSGLIWIAFVPQSVSGSVNKFNAIQGSNMFVNSTSIANIGACVGFGQTGVTGALPSSWGATYNELQPTNFPVMYVKTA